MSDRVTQSLSVPFPRLLWNYYLEYLWNYESGSWVATIASTCRILAILISLPIAVLALLDISSYLIARTLGVIDDVKASTSDSIVVSSVDPSISVLQTETSINNTENENDSARLGVSLPRAFYASEDNNLKLSGVGVFSPADSRSPSPPPQPKVNSDKRKVSDETLRRRTGMPKGTDGY